MTVFRCIRPNAKNRAAYFDADKVLLQLRYTGVMETVKIRHLGYSYRLTFADFISRCELRYIFVYNTTDIRGVARNLFWGYKNFLGRYKISIFMFNSRSDVISTP